MDDNDEMPILPPEREVHTYKRRWYILALFSLAAILQDAVWNTWGPIDHTAKYLYGWSDDLIALFANYGSILYIVAFIPVVYLLQKSLRGAMLMTTGFMALGTILRCGFLQDAHISDYVFTVSCHVCAILNGISNVVVGSAPLVISSEWFPPEERVTATSIAQVFNGLGTGMSFLLSSQLVRPIDHYINDTTNATLPPDVEAGYRKDIQIYMYSQAIPAGLFFLMSVLYFPSRPAKPPSFSSGEERLDFFNGFKEVMKNKVAWAIAIGSSIPQGIMIAWTAMMVVNLTQVCAGGHCLTQHWVNYLGIYSTVASTISAILVARLVDKVKGYLKLIIIILLGLAGFVFIFLTLISQKILVFKHIVNVEISVFLLLLLGSSLVVATMPLSMELAMEACYPVSECVVGGWISIWFNIASVIFLTLFGIPGIGTSWLDYVLPVSCFMALPFFILFRVEYKRSAIDDEKSTARNSIEDLHNRTIDSDDIER